MATIYYFKRYKNRLRRKEKKQKIGTVCGSLGRIIKQFCIRNFTQSPEQRGSRMGDPDPRGSHKPCRGI